MSTLNEFIVGNRSYFGFGCIAAFAGLISAFALPIDLSLLGANAMALQTNSGPVIPKANNNNILIQSFVAFQLNVILTENPEWKLTSSDFTVIVSENQDYLYLTLNQRVKLENSSSQLVLAIQIAEKLSRKGHLVTIDGSSTVTPTIRVKLTSRSNIS